MLQHQYSTRNPGIAAGATLFSLIGLILFFYGKGSSAYIIATLSSFAGAYCSYKFFKPNFFNGVLTPNKIEWSFNGEVIESIAKEDIKVMYFTYNDELLKIELSNGAHVSLDDPFFYFGTELTENLKNYKYRLKDS